MISATLILIGHHSQACLQKHVFSYIFTWDPLQSPHEEVLQGTNFYPSQCPAQCLVQICLPDAELQEDVSWKLFSKLMLDAAFCTSCEIHISMMLMNA